MSTEPDAGLFLVYMSLESGTEQGLHVLNKDNRAAEFEQIYVFWMYSTLIPLFGGVN